ncbi:MAG: 5-formyltetrahydrofolate cyclo-ligase [Epulopiscium sp.]|jgi:5-formyltetrahydrofolate cyclo-ligase|uniref:5-formyltetrahydrofolate cyclo-ligase n=1 Tax=Defluviitalea raffinosedens TaxID=1450156 RepID=A0A7C8LKW6_9FIRM|nr:5-formyltetrahydrofolate cyclo-ligase [Defluviitalea raffinosedens]MBZ4667820.1 5-formyltetrahydrofolate cyclo-ligase [Defluviitaleaceae bacterium]MDK2788431.1 5-formyltetrahydrofolate cyclo-ligase [Candidatus Epulonipiscium sp.]KAE9636884.1 5-formyltetrahydrofolate cyclo-ligase [Defluviitalea raffinosedens]MBM7686407.1 5-formyltetrahydrofolate cyclo-ligase [Defluviitalea raffinosedens]HHW67193.1 5-formyltetrahydrofolate cyclo-ligase [Candidatus Epulonipiscium sp.]
MTEKQRLRKIFLDMRAQMPEEEIYYKSQFIYEKLIHSSLYHQCKMIFTYVSMGNEVDTKKVILRGLLDRKIIAVPKVNPKKKEMIFSKIKSLDELEAGHFNVLEPREDCIQPIESNQETLILVPGAVFGRDKNRIGYGGGYYDRYLSSVKGALKIIGLGYDFQLIDKIPSDPYDVPLDTIVTDKGWIK